MLEFEWDDNKNQSNQEKHKISFEDAADFDSVKVESLDAMKLAKAGIVIPSNAIYYNDEDIEFDEDFEGEWVSTSQTNIKITLSNDIKQWVVSNNVRLEQLVEKLLENFYSVQKIVVDK